MGPRRRRVPDGRPWVGRRALARVGRHPARAWLRPALPLLLLPLCRPPTTAAAVRPVKRRPPVVRRATTTTASRSHRLVSHAVPASVDRRRRRPPATVFRRAPTTTATTAVVRPGRFHRLDPVARAAAEGPAARAAAVVGPAVVVRPAPAPAAAARPVRLLPGAVVGRPRRSCAVVDETLWLDPNAVARAADACPVGRRRRLDGPASLPSAPATAAVGPVVVQPYDQRASARRLVFWLGPARARAAGRG